MNVNVLQVEEAKFKKWSWFSNWVDVAPDFCPTNCGGIVSLVGGGVYCERCGYKERM